MIRRFDPQGVFVRELVKELEHLRSLNLLGSWAVNEMPPPDHDVLAELLEVAFWASLGTDEERSTRVRVALVPAQHRLPAFELEQTIPYDERHVVKLAQAVPTNGTLLVSQLSEGLRITGVSPATLDRDSAMLTARVTRPGTVLVGFNHYSTFAVADGRSEHFVRSAAKLDLPAHLKRALRKETPSEDIAATNAAWRECRGFVALARLILESGHGGLFLVVPDERAASLDALRPFAYELKEPDESIPLVIRRQADDVNETGRLLEALASSNLPDDMKTLAYGLKVPSWGEENFVIANLASLSGVDGAIVVTSRLALLGFGATLAADSDGDVPICRFRAVTGLQTPEQIDLKSTGGTKHQAAAKFVATYRDCVALVISQDAHLAVMRWDVENHWVEMVANTEWWF